MFLRATTRKKDGKEHRYFSVVENRRVAGGRVLQRHVLYLGEINSSQQLAWRKSIEVLEDGERVSGSLALFPEDRCEGLAPDASIVRLRLSQLRVCRPRQWGACWLALTLWQELKLDEFWAERLPPSRKRTQVLFVLVAYRLIEPGSEWRLHRHWYEQTALSDLLGADESLADSHALYACHDRLLAHKETLFSHLVGTPKGRLNRLEQDLVTKPWRMARPGVRVKLLPQDGELYVFAESQDRIAKERSMRRRQLEVAVGPARAVERDEPRARCAAHEAG